ncbi:hypothetical protein FOVSG1_006213 [Fusarium oxysporum f. sp. vasinfectum]
MPATSSDSQLDLRRRKRLKIDLACDICRRRKVKCDGARPVCGNCLKRSGLQGRCVYIPISSERRAGSSSSIGAAPPGLGKIPSESDKDCMQQPKSDGLQQPQILEPTLPLPAIPMHHQRSTASAFLSDPSNICTEPTSQTVGGSGTGEHFGSSSNGTFTGQIKAAIDAKFGRCGLPPSPSAVPLVDASMFPPLQDETAIDGTAGGMEYELPPRKQADHLINTYWSFVDPLFPVLSKPHFMHSYSALFSGSPVDTNERMLVSTLNTMFALSIQLQESLKPNQREHLSGKYFRRAQELLRLPIWERGSIELIQCLLVMSQYLQCTNKPHETWMVVGAAVRIAQGLGLHLPETWTSPSNDLEAALKRQIWQACIFMDRMICALHGRPMMISETLASTVIVPQRPSSSQQNKDDQLPYQDFFTKTLELYEITNHTVQKFYSPAHTRSQYVDHPGIVKPSQDEEKLAIIIQVDGCLSRWEHSLPAHLKLGNSEYQPDDICRRQATILHLRLLHSRILLFRPMLARCCLSTETDNFPDGNLSAHMMQQCASACVEAAQKMIFVLHQHQRHDGSVGVLPAWWYRVFYIYTAAMILAVSTLRPDLFAPSEIVDTWEKALLLFQAHEHLSESVRVCVAALQMMFEKIEQTQHVAVSSVLFDGNLPEPQEATVRGYPGFIQEVPFDLNNSLFNLDSMSWLIDGQNF